MAMEPNQSKIPSSYAPNETRPLLQADFQAIHQQHANMWTVYNSSIRMLLTVAGLPVLVAGALSVSKTPFVDNLPIVLPYALVLTPVLSFLAVSVVIHYRLDILFYARWLNGYRKVFFEMTKDEPRLHGELKRLPIPIDSSQPALYEPLGPMGFIVHGCALVNAVYLGMGVEHFCPNTYMMLPMGGALLFAAALEHWYRWSAKRVDSYEKAQQASTPAQ